MYTNIPIVIHEISLLFLGSERVAQVDSELHMTRCIQKNWQKNVYIACDIYVFSVIFQTQWSLLYKIVS